MEDIFIIGGGINGVAIAAEAASRGLTVTLCEKNDLASGTSFASSKLIHGGLRYLESYEFHLVRKALQEREILLHKAPNIISPLEFILPHQKHLRPAWLIRLGLFLYDHLASHPLLPNSKKINLQNNIRGKELLPEFKTGFSYYDGFSDDARLVILTALFSKEHGASILTHTSFISANFEEDKWKIQILNNLTKHVSTFFSRVLINAAGPWVIPTDENIATSNQSVKVDLIKGSHIVVPKIYEGDFAYILQNPDQRVVFAIPYENAYTLIGTTDIPFTKNPDDVRITPEEENYLCNTINNYFKKSISPADIVWSYAGVRCLQAENEANPAKITRDYKFEFSTAKCLLTVISGKLTTHRSLAEEIIKKIENLFPTIKPSITKKAFLPGGDIPGGNLEKFFKTLIIQYPWMPEKILRRYAKNYGTRTALLLQNTTCVEDLGDAYSKDLFQVEIDYLIKHEWAKTAEDVLWRRTKLGLTYPKANLKKLEDFLSSKC